MSASQGAIVRHRIAGDPRIAVLAALPLIVTLLAAGVASADLPPGVIRLSPTEAERFGSVIHLVRRPVAGATLVEVDPPGPGASLLAMSSDGRVAALADRVGEPSGVLTLAMDDGSQLRIAFPGLLSAAFATDGSWLAVVDGRGALWRLDAASGIHELLLDGPFIGSPVIAADGSLLLLAVPSVEAPYRSHLVRLASGGETAQAISDTELVYAAFPLEGDALAVVMHDARSGTVVRRIAGGTERPWLELGDGAINVAVARNGLVAFERAGEGILMVDGSGSPPRSIGAGSRPCFGSEGSVLLVERDGGRVALAVDGSVLAVADHLAGLAGSEGCAP